MKSLRPLLLLLPFLLIISCASSNPSGRIEQNPKVYNDLSVKEQELVSRGQIAEGMEPGAVYLALGRPERELEGYSEGVRTLRWDYTTLSPIYSNSFYGGVGYGRGGYGRYGGRGNRYNNFGISPTIEYVPTRSNTVWFENGKVRSYERIRS